MRHRMFCIALSVLAAGMVFGQWTAHAASAEKGKAAFMKYGCWQCHGTQGQGSVATSGGRVLAPDPLPYDHFSALVRSSKNGMPPYSATILPNDDLADIYAYLSSIPKSKDHMTIPLLSQ